jgi:hypothetical protein
MKQIFASWKLVGAVALLVGGFCGCAGTKVQNKESLLSAAGFQRRTPSTPAQLATYNQMTPYKLERSTINGKALYTYADKQNRVVYIGGDKAYQHYRQLALQQSMAEKELEASYSNYLQNIDQIYSINYD